MRKLWTLIPSYAVDWSIVVELLLSIFGLLFAFFEEIPVVVVNAF